MALAPSAEDQGVSAETPVADTPVVAVETSQVDTDAKISAESSTAGDKSTEQQKPSMLDAIKSALEPKTEDATAESQAAKPEATVGDAVAPPAEDDKPPPFHKHPAWQRQLQKVSERDKVIADLTPKAERFDAMQDMMARNNLVNDEVTAGFNIMASMKSDPFKALELLRPYWDALLVATGEKLPADLADQAETGAIPEDRAKEISTLRARTAVAERSTKREAQAQEQTTHTQMVSSLVAWEDAWKSSDPDYSKKAEAVEERLSKLLRETPARNPADLVRLAQKARTDVEERFKGARGNPTPKVPAIPAPSSAPTTPKPRTSMEAIMQGIQSTPR